MIMINSVFLFLAAYTDNEIEDNFQISLAVFYIFSISICVILIKFRQITKYLKAIGMVVLSEILTIFYIILCNQNYEVYCPNISWIQLFNILLQMNFFKDGLSYSIIIFKHIAIAYWWNSPGGYFYFLLYHLAPFMLAATFLRSLQEKAALNDVYKLKMKTLRLNLTQISCGISEGLLVLSTNNQILFTSSILFEHLECELTEVLKILPNLLYITHNSDSKPSAKLLSLYDDIKFCIESNILYKKLGRTQHNAKVLEWIFKKIEWNSQESVLLTVNDVTELHDMECRFKDSIFKSSLLKIVSHELRTPCNSIMFFSEKSMESTDNSSPLYEYLTIVKNSSTYMLLLINDILDYTKIISGNFRINQQEFCPSELLTECTQLFEYQARKKNLSIYLVIDKTVPLVAYSDSIRLKQILLNLLSNSLK